MYPTPKHRSHKSLNNRAENSHQPTRRREKILVKFKSPQGTQKMLSLMGKVRNIFGRYTKTSLEQRVSCTAAKSIWNEAASRLLPA